MRALLSLVVVLVLALAAYTGANQPSLRVLLGIVVPSAAFLVFLAGITWRVIVWARSAVPFRIPVTCGQQASLAWMKRNRLDNPATTLGVVGRMAIEVLLFRSLFRSARAEMLSGRLVFREATGLWLGAVAFHYALLFVVLRHLRFVTEPVPALVTTLASIDSFFRIGIPALYATDVLLVVALGYLLSRRVRQAQVRYVSLFSDYLLLFVLLGIATTGLLMRHVVRVDTVAVKELAMGLVTLSRPAVLPSLHPLVFAHLALVSVLFVCLPFTKLAHMAGVFLSPTRNLANDNRSKRHVNPWNEPVKVHTYAEWEEEFRDKLLAAGLPVDASTPLDVSERSRSEGKPDHV